MSNLSLLELWLSSSTVSETDKANIRSWTVAKQKAFFQETLQFTTGFRGPIALGSKCFNRYNLTVIGLALVKLWLKKLSPTTLPFQVLIGHDHRHQSLETSELLAAILQKFNIQPYFFTHNGPVPTPFLSFVLKQSQQFEAGIMVTASHSGKNINGIKMFNRFGYPWNEAENKRLNALISSEYRFLLNQKLALSKQRVAEIASNWKNQYLNSLSTSLQVQNLTTFSRQQVKILFSPLHGLGLNWTDQLLKANNYSVVTLPSQANLDPNFKTINQPNPETDTTFQLAKNFALQIQPQLVILNDGDADRMRAACYDDNVFRLLSGNEIAIIFIYFLLKEKKKKGTIYCSYVSTPLVEIIAKAFNVQVVRTATGFGNLANHYRNSTSQNFVFAFEESLGFLVDTAINHDKDGLQGALLLAEIMTFCHQNKTTLWQYLQNIYAQYGYWQTQTHLYQLSPNSDFVNKYHRLQVGQKFGDLVLTSKQSLFLENAFISSLFLLFFNNDSSLAIRKSQTEPVGKVYFFASGNPPTTQKSIDQLFALAKKYWEFRFFLPNPLK